MVPDLAMDQKHLEEILKNNNNINSWFTLGANESKYLMTLEVIKSNFHDAQV